MSTSAGVIYVCEVSLQGRRIKSDSVVKIVPRKEKYVLNMSEVLFCTCIVATSGSTSESPMEDNPPGNAEPDNEAIKVESDNEAINAIGTFPSTRGGWTWHVHDLSMHMTDGLYTKDCSW